MSDETKGGAGHGVSGAFEAMSLFEQVAHTAPFAAGVISAQDRIAALEADLAAEREKVLHWEGESRRISALLSIEKEIAANLREQLAANRATAASLDQSWRAERDMWHAKEAELRTRLEAAERERDAIAELNHGQFLQLEYLRPVEKAAHLLYTESEEYDFDDGMGRGAQQTWWDDLAKAFEPATDAIAAEIDAAIQRGKEGS